MTRLEIAMHLLAGHAANPAATKSIEHKDIIATTLDVADALLAAAEKPAAAAPVVWTDEARDFKPGEMDRLAEVVRAHGSAPLPSIQPAPVVPVKFTDDGDAFGTDWEATRSSAGDSVFVTITLRPGEDAGETVAKMLAPVGRGP